MMRRMLIALSLMFASCGAASAQCNSPSGFIQSFGTFTQGDVPVFGPDCNHIQDSLGGNVVIPAINPVTFGADPTCVKDSRAAFNAAFAAAIAANTSGFVLIPPGHFCFTSGNVTANLGAGLSSIRVEGSGSEVTLLDFQNAGGFVVNFTNGFNSAHFSEMTIETGTNNTQFGLRFLLLPFDTAGALSTYSDVTRVVFRGDDGLGVTHNWVVGFEQNNISNVNVIGCSFIGAPDAAPTGTGINFTGNGGLSSSPVVLNVIASNFIDNSVGINYSTLAQGLTVTNSNFTNDVTGINVSGGLAIPLTELNVSSSQFEARQTGIGLNSLVTAVNISNSLFIVPSTASGVVMAATQDFSIVGNVFSSIGLGSGTGISIQGAIAGSGGSIIGNSFRQFTTALSLLGTSGNTIVSGNAFGGNTTNISNASLTNFVYGNVPAGPGLPWLNFSIGATINFNLVGDTSFQIPVQPGFTKFRVQAAYVYNCSAINTTSQVEIFTAAGGGGSGMTALTTGIITATGPNTNGSAQTIAGVSAWYLVSASPFFFRVVVPQGAPVSCAADIAIAYFNG